MPKYLPVPSGSVVITLLRDSCEAKSRKTDDDGSPCARGCCAMFWQTDTGSMLVIRAPRWDSLAMGANVSGITGIDFDIDSIRSRSGGQDAVTYM
jgi:hypothetical protein